MGIGGALEMATDEEISSQMDTNFMGMVRMCRAVLPIMRKQRQGKIINISSIAGRIAVPYQGFYSASKFAIEGYSEALSMGGISIQAQSMRSGTRRFQYRIYSQPEHLSCYIGMP